MKQRIGVFSVCYNEEKILPFYLDYYLNFLKVSKIIICDGGSTDRSHEIIRKYSQVELIIQDQSEGANEDYFRFIRNNLWKKYKNEFDWVIVCDMDEFLYHPDIHNKLFEYKKSNISIPLTSGYEMMSLVFPTFNEGEYIVNLVRNGILENHWLGKKIIFDPQKIEEINYGHGSHDCDPCGDVKYTEANDLMMLHYKWLSYEYLTSKSSFLVSRQSDWNLKNDACNHWSKNSKITKEEFIEKYNQTMEIKELKLTFNDQENLKIWKLNELENFMSNESNISKIQIYDDDENEFLISYLNNKGYSKENDNIFIKPKEKPIYIFSHNYLINNWKEILLEQLNKIKINGLYKNSKKLFLFAYGEDSEWKELVDLIFDYDIDDKITLTRHKENFYEYYTIQSLWDFCQNIDESYILYFHLKGVWSRHNIQTDVEDDYNPNSPIKNTEALLQWKNCLEYFNIERWYNCVDKLNEGYNRVGALYNYNDLEPLYTGNFWWANSIYIKDLKRLEYNIKDEPFSAKIWCRVKCEKWINHTKDPNFFNIYNPKDLDLYHYVINPNDYRDDINPLISILTPTYKRYDELKEAINSVSNQTYKNWEMLICSDGDDDNVKALINNYNDNRIKYYSTEKTNNWGSTQRNYLTKICNGKYLIYLDDDNLLYPNALQDIINNLDFNTGMIIAKIDYDGLDHQLPINNKIKLGKIDTLNAVVEKRFIKYVSWKNYVGHDYEFIKICENNIINDGKNIKFIPNVIGRHVEKGFIKNEIPERIEKNDIDIILKDKIYITPKIDIINSTINFRGEFGNIIYSFFGSILRNNQHWFLPDDRSFQAGIKIDIVKDNNTIYQSDFIKRKKTNRIKNKIILFHHNYLRFKWFDILDEQIKELKNSGLYESCSEVIATIYSEFEDRENRKIFKEYIKNEDYLNKWTIIDLYENNFEYDVLKIMKKYCEYSKEEVYICYFHLKGVCSSVIDRNIGIPYWRKYLNYFTITKWKNNALKLNEYDLVALDYQFNEMHQRYVIGGHFFWTKSSHIKNLEDITVTKNRYLPEIWINSIDCKVYSNFHAKDVGITDLYLQPILPEMYQKDKIVLVCIAKDEDYYIEEWLNYNFKLGFDHIFMYENNWKCNIELPYLTKIKWSGDHQQLLAYNHFIDTYGDDYDYAAFFDCDEFLVLKKHNNIHDFIKEYGGRNIGINWQFYGSQGKERRECNSLLKQFTKRQFGIDNHVKSIIYLKLEQWMERGHHPTLEMYDTNNNIIKGPWNSNGTDDVVIINHYRDKTKEDYLNFVKRGQVDVNRVVSIKTWEDRINSDQDIEDMTALNFLYEINKLNHFYENINGWSSMEEQGILLETILKELNLSNKIRIVELGVYQGRLTSMWNVTLNNKEINYEYYAIDHFQGYENEDKNVNYYELTLKNLSPILEYSKNKINIIKNSTVNESRNYQDEFFDIIYIDASHNYEDVKNDIVSWLPKLKKDGIICGDDFIKGWDGVIQAVTEQFGIINKIGNQQWWWKNNKDLFWNISNIHYRIQQKETEWKEFINFILNNIKLDNCLEIGCNTLGTTSSLIKIFKNVFSIDISRYDTWDKFEQENKNWNYFIGDSKSEDIINKIKNLNIKFDLIFIDGDHTYEGVKQDFEKYKNFISDNGVIVFHDILDTNFHRNANCYVHDFWNEIKNQYEYKEFIDNEENEDSSNLSHKGYKKSDWGGIGVLIKKEIKKILIKNISIFHHNYLVGNWKSILEELIIELVNSGLYKETKKIYTTVFSEDKSNYKEFIDLIKIYDTDNKWIIIELNENNFEINCLELLYNHCKYEDCYVLYFNNKGVTHDKPTTSSWRKYMTHFNINQYKKAIEILNNFDTYGVDLHEHPYLHYSGNFWWSKSEHIRKLDIKTLFLNEFNNKDNINVGFPMHRRHNCEMWITSLDNGKYHSEWESNTDFYNNSYPEDSYKCLNNDKIPFEDRLKEEMMNKYKLDFVFSNQNKQELEKLLEIIKSYNKKNILEIGVEYGGTTYEFCKTFDNVYSIDIKKYETWDLINEECPNWKYFVGRSDSNEILDKIKKLNMKFDVLFIDGDHSYESVKKDFNLYKDFVSEDGIIAFHDIIDGSINRNCNAWVYPFWEEIKNDYEYEEILYDNGIKKLINFNDYNYNTNNNNLRGIGLIKKSNDKKVIIMTAHPNFKTSEEITKKSIESFYPTKYDIILSTHCPVSEDIQKSVTHFIYDKNNPLIRHDFYNQSWFDRENYYALIKLNKNDNDLQHALAVYINYFNGIIQAKNMGYNTAICTNFDLIFDQRDLDLINEKIKEMKLHNKKSFFLTSKATEGIHYKTIFFITDIDFFIENFKYIKDEKTYNEITREVGSETNCLENYFYQTLKNKKDDLLLQEMSENDFFKYSKINLFSNIEYFTILPLRNDNNNFIIWYSSSNSFDDNRELKIKVLKNDECVFLKSDVITKNYTYFKQIEFEKNSYYKIVCEITYNDLIKEKIIELDNVKFSQLNENGEFYYK